MFGNMGEMIYLHTLNLYTMNLQPEQMMEYNKTRAKMFNLYLKGREMDILCSGWYKVRVKVVNVRDPKSMSIYAKYRCNLQVVDVVKNCYIKDENGKWLKTPQGRLATEWRAVKSVERHRVNSVNSDIRRAVDKAYGKYAEMFSIDSFRFSVDKIKHK